MICPYGQALEFHLNEDESFIANNVITPQISNIKKRFMDITIEGSIPKKRKVDESFENTPVNKRNKSNIAAEVFVDLVPEPPVTMISSTTVSSTSFVPETPVFSSSVSSFVPETPGPFCVDISREDLSDSFNENKSAEIISIPETPLESQRTYHVLSTSDHSNVESWSNAGILNESI